MPIPEHFNLLDEPWIKVSNQDGQTETVSLLHLFDHIQDYRQLAGDMHVQDLAILRFLLAILITVYSRFDADGQFYNWLDIDPDTFQIRFDNENELNEDYDENLEDLLDTWSQLYQQGHFTPDVKKYLEKYRQRFDLFDDKTPFCQVTLDEYNKAVGDPKKGVTLPLKNKPTGEIPIKTLNRTINESGNSPSIFASRSDSEKDTLTPAELTRWLITYQGYSTASEKIKVDYPDRHNYNYSNGYLYTIKPTYVKGHNLFETLMLNLTLSNDRNTSLIERPIWEAPDIHDYLEHRKSGIMPDNIAELYTLPSRIFYLNTQDNHFRLFGAKVFSVDNQDNFVEPMTTYYLKKAKKENDTSHWYPNNLGNLPKRPDDYLKSMWANFGEYLSTKNTEHNPGVVNWVRQLQLHSLIPQNTYINLTTTGLIWGGTSSSQIPAFEIYNQMELPPAVAFDRNQTQTWPDRIANVVEQTNTAIHTYQTLSAFVALFHGIHGQTINDPALKAFSEPAVKQIYTELNKPFANWLYNLNINDDRDEKSREWYQTVRHILNRHCQEFLYQLPTHQLEQRITIHDYNTSAKSAFAKEPHNMLQIVSYYQHVMMHYLPINKSTLKEDVKSNESTKSRLSDSTNN